MTAEHFHPNEEPGYELLDDSCQQHESLEPIGLGERYDAR
jgi:hypothetical protein